MHSTPQHPAPQESTSPTRNGSRPPRRSSSGAPTVIATPQIALVHAVPAIAAGTIDPGKGTPPHDGACHIQSI